MKKVIEKIKEIPNSYVALALILLVVLVVIIANMSFADPLSNDANVAAGSELTYYLDVNYDGVDRDGVVSSDSAVSDVKSGEIVVEDRIPDGLTFEGFVTTENGTIGAVTREDDAPCVGTVVDDTNEASNAGVWNNGNTEYTYHGLHYTTSDRTVRFRVQNLQAGCYLTVGIITKTPVKIDDVNTQEVETRRDFYNFASAREKNLTVNSNVVHAYMGDSSLTLYGVSYSYTGTVPAGAPTAPATTNYGVNATVGVAANVDVEGYTFSGWSTNDVTVSSGTFRMPASNVAFTGSFTENGKHRVTYTISGDAPDNYVVPLEKQYYENSKVDLDSLEVGDIINGYRFLGWTSNDVVISNGSFAMGNSNVSIVGSFEEVTYHVYYQFDGAILPPNPDNYLPSAATYSPGDTVTLATVDDSLATGYKFLGWYSEDEFEMPDHDVVILGEWKEVAGTLSFSVTQEILNAKSSYTAGETVNFKITITNNNNFAVDDIYVKASNENVVFANSANYESVSNHIIKIGTLAANSSIEILASYTVGNDDEGEITSVITIRGASSSNNYVLDTDNLPTSSVSFTAGSYAIKIILTDRDDSSIKLSAAEYNLCTASNDDTTCFTTITTDNLGVGEYSGVSSGTYYLKQKKATTGYVLDDSTTTVQVSGNTIDNNGYVNVNLVNRKMGSLPFTGGSGTVIYTILGVIVILMAVLSGLFITKRKKILYNIDGDR